MPINMDETIKHGLDGLIKIIDTKMQDISKKVTVNEYKKMTQELDFIRKIAENPLEYLTAPRAQSAVVYRTMDFKINTLTGYCPRGIIGVRWLDGFLSCAYDYYRQDGYYKERTAARILKMNKQIQLQSATGILNKFKNYFLEFASPERFAIRADAKSK